MSNELFDESEVRMDSPKLAWMKRHGIISHALPRPGMKPLWVAGFREWRPGLKEADFFPKEIIENDFSRIGEGEAEEEALGDLMTSHHALTRKIKLWNEEAGS